MELDSLLCFWHARKQRKLTDSRLKTVQAKVPFSGTDFKTKRITIERYTDFSGSLWFP